MRIYLSILLYLCFQVCHAQKLEITSFKQVLSDGSAFHAPLDKEGNPCGLIKVRTSIPNLVFKGDIVGDVENKMNEYWVYLPQNSQLLKICHPNLLPLTVSMTHYGIEISSKSSYVLNLEESKFKKEKTSVTVVTKPTDAILCIDDILIDNIGDDGLYQLYLPKGDHICRISKTGYRPHVQAIQSGKTPQNLNIELESVMAELEVKCKTTTPEIFIDEVLRGTGIWKGGVSPGEHKIEVKQNNYEPIVQIISIAEKEEKTISIPELKRIAGKMYIETTPSSLPISIDGKRVGVSPCSIEVATGKHYISCDCYGIEPYRSEVDIESLEMKRVLLSLEFKKGNLYDFYKKAYNGDLHAIICLASEAGSEEDYEQAFYWINMHPQKEYIMSHWALYWKRMYEQGYRNHHGNHLFNWIEMYSLAGNPEKALQLYPIVKREEESCGSIFLGELYMRYIGDSFFKKNEIDKAISCYERSGEDGYEGLGDCYAEKGNKQLAASYYRKCLNKEYVDNRNRIEKKLKELGY